MEKNRAYWQKRFEQIQIAQVNKGAEYYKTLEEEFNRACANIQADIDKWYMRFADSEGITLQEAKKRLNAKELEEFKWTVEEYIEKGKTLKYSDEFAKQLENASCRVRISRLEALKLQLQAQVEQLYGNMIDGLDRLIKDTYAHGFYHTCFELEKGIGLGINISGINSRKLETIISNPWASDGINFSQRIWGKYRPQLVQTLHTELTQACIRGDNPKKLIDKIAKRFRATKQQAGNLVMTESAYFSSLSTQDGYKEIGVAQYEILATLDLHTSDICRSLDGKPFPISEYQPWVTAPPFHNRCRSTTCPYFDDEFTVDEKRIARNLDGSQCLVPANMTYEEWYNECVKGDTIAELEEKKINNEYADRKQYEEYKKVLGKDAPQSLDDFQNLKYTDSNKWSMLKDFADSKRSSRIAKETTLKQWEDIVNEVNEKIVGISTVNGIKISELSHHGIERFIGDGEKRMGVLVEDVRDALLNPLEIKDIKIDNLGRKSQKFVGENATISINPDTGNIIQTNPTSSKLAERLKRRLKDD